MRRYPNQSVPEAYLRQFFETVLVKALEAVSRSQYEEAVLICTRFC